jgi:thymidylate synthase
VINVISGNSPLDAWANAADQLLANKGCQAQDLIVEINDPTATDEDIWFEQYDPRQFGGSDGPSDVANTIFPIKTWENSADRSAFYARYIRAHKRSKNKRWGTYFLRLIDFGNENVNQLERALTAVAEWKNSPRNAICFHLSSPQLDGLVPRGGPCLQAIQVHLRNDLVDFSVMYRNHDYFNKAFPNFIGLGRLLQFFSDETGRTPGKIVCLSAHAYADSKKKLKALRHA